MTYIKLAALIILAKSPQAPSTACPWATHQPLTMPEALFSGGPCPVADLKTEAMSVCESPGPPGHSAPGACWTLGHETEP